MRIFGSDVARAIHVYDIEGTTAGLPARRGIPHRYLRDLGGTYVGLPTMLVVPQRYLPSFRKQNPSCPQGLGSTFFNVFNVTIRFGCKRGIRFIYISTFSTFLAVSVNVGRGQGTQHRRFIVEAL